MKDFLIDVVKMAVVALVCFGFVFFSITYATGKPKREEATTTDVEITTTDEVIIQEVKEEAPKEEVPEFVSLGIFRVSAYCCENYPHICNDGDATKTSTGTTPTPGRTIAVDPDVIPYGTEVQINGHTYIAEDCGGGISGKEIDICFLLHDNALDFGIQNIEVFVKR